MKKRQLLRELHEVRSAWDELLARIPSERMIEPGAIGEWSIKDILVHVAWVEGQIAQMLRARKLEDPAGLWRLSEEERNAAVVAQNRDRPLPEALRESRRAHTELLALIEEIKDQDFDGADWFAELPGKWPPSRVIEVNVLDHYREHIEDLALWYRLNV
ncbi:MAG: ClbS/DfsB family four-helix bundle protein [Chloroflexi bacterium]|nr:ClbS/DfsB family four-helix bundle protein [Chloroflexota bacterium]